MPLKYQNDGPVNPNHPINEGKSASVASPSIHQGVPMQGADKYHGDVVDNYDKKREQQPRWHAEQKIIETALRCIPDGSTILDVPIGTGRWFDVMREKGHQLVGVDVSEDMLTKAQSKIQEGDKVMLIKGPSWATGLEAQSVDCSVMCRLTRWLSPDERKATLMELQRVTRSLIVFTARVANHQYAYPLEEIDKAVDHENWAAAWSYGASEDDYRVMALAHRSSPWFKDGEVVGLPIEVV